MKRLLSGLLGVFLCTEAHAVESSAEASAGAWGGSVLSVASGLQPILSQEDVERAWSFYRGGNAQINLRVARLEMEAVAPSLSQLIDSASSGDVKESLKRRYGEFLYTLGRMCFRGEGGRVDVGRSISLYEQAAVYGHSRASRALALMFDVGLGVRKDPYRALALYERDSLSGDLSSTFHKARMLANLGDKDRAIESYRQVFEGNPDYTSAYFNLSVLLKDRDSEESRHLIESGIEHRYRHMSALLLYVLENDFAPPPMITYVDPRIYSEESDRGYGEARAYDEATIVDASPPILALIQQNGILLEQLLFFSKELGMTLGSLNYFFHDPYISAYRPSYRGAPAGASQESLQGFLRECLESYSKPKARSFIYDNEPGKEFLERAITQTLGMEGPVGELLRETFAVAREQLVRDPRSLLKSVPVRVRPEEAHVRVLETARGLFIELMLEQMDPFRGVDGDSLRPYASLLVYSTLTSLIERMTYYHVDEGQSLGVSISKLIYKLKRSILEESAEQFAGGNPLETLKIKHALYISLGSRIGLLDKRGVERVSYLIPREDGVYNLDYNPSIRHFVRELVGKEEESLNPHYTETGLVQLMKRALFDTYDGNITASLLTDVAFVDEELRSLYYHALLMNGRATDYFDPYGEDSQENGRLYDDPRCLIYGDATFKTILRRFKYLEA